MSTVAEIEEAASKLPPDEFARLMEDLRDLAISRLALSEMEAGENPVLWESLKTELDVLHG